MNPNDDIAALFEQHIASLSVSYQRAFTETGLDTNSASLVIYSGSQRYYFADDRTVPFQAFGHFLNWVPVNRPDQFLIVRPGTKPVLLQLIPSDFWHDQRLEIEDWWSVCFELKSQPNIEALAQELPAGPLYFMGESQSDTAAKLGRELLPAPTEIWQFLNYQRAYKSDYELVRLREASQKGLQGHQAAKQAFEEGASEFQIHQAYLGACEVLEDQSPYTNIIALDSNAAILHYQNKSRVAADKSKVLLIDAGYRQFGYGSDITRTWTRGDGNERFQALVAGVADIELSIVEQVRPGVAYPSLHQQAMEGVGRLLLELDICRGDLETLLTAEIPQRFMPHGIGHLLGIQVHDVAGHQQDCYGKTLAPPASSPALRLTRELAENMVFTVEPGCYFIPMLLEPLRAESYRGLIDFDIVEQLYPLGGVRIEDNVRVTGNGAENLTRNAEGRLATVQ